MTQGTQKAVDIDRLGEILDDPGSEAVYLKEWRNRRERMGYTMRFLQAKIFELAPNVALGAIRRYGDDEIKEPLKLKTAQEQQAIDALKSTKLYKALIKDVATAASSVKPTASETQLEFIRLQRKARSHDKQFNKALAALIQAALTSDGFDVEVIAEKVSIAGLPSIPDILVKFSEGRHVCLEPTWRTTGKAADNLEEQQNTLTVGHVQQYFLQKMLNYAKGLDM